MGLEFNPEWVEEAAKGDSSAQTLLYNYSFNKVYMSVKSMVSDEDLIQDVIQDTYIKAFASLDMLGNPEMFISWIKAIAHNKMLDELRKNKPLLFSQITKEGEEDDDFELQIEDTRTYSIPENVVDIGETARLVREILDSLSEGQRLAVGMYYYEELSVKEIARKLEISEKTVKVQLHRGRKSLEEKIRELEKKGTKLYGIAPLPFFLMLIKSMGGSSASSGVIAGVGVATASEAAALGALTPGAVTVTNAASIGIMTPSAITVSNAATLGVMTPEAVSVSSAAKLGIMTREAVSVSSAAKIGIMTPGANAIASSTTMEMMAPSAGPVTNAATIGNMMPGTGPVSSSTAIEMVTPEAGTVSNVVSSNVIDASDITTSVSTPVTSTTSVVSTSTEAVSETVSANATSTTLKAVSEAGAVESAVGVAKAGLTIKKAVAIILLSMTIGAVGAVVVNNTSHKRGGGYDEESYSALERYNDPQEILEVLMRCASGKEDVREVVDKYILPAMYSKQGKEAFIQDYIKKQAVTVSHVEDVEIKYIIEDRRDESGDFAYVEAGIYSEYGEYVDIEGLAVISIDYCIKYKDGKEDYEMGKWTFVKTKGRWYWKE